MLSKQEAIDEFRSAGAEPGDSIMVYSSLRAVGPIEGGADTLIDALLEVVGDSGTVLFPTFNFVSWTESHYWDVLETPSEMGVLTEVARKRPDARRTPHPIYSFAVIGAHAQAFQACDDIEAFGERSVFALFDEMNGLMLSVGLHFNSTFTQTHYAERLAGAAHRRVKTFGGIYVGYDRLPVLKSYAMFVRRDGVKTWIVPAVDELVERGEVRQFRFGRAPLHSVRSNVYVSEIRRIARETPLKLHEAGKPGA